MPIVSEQHSRKNQVQVKTSKSNIFFKKIKKIYSWIAHQLDIATTAYRWLSGSQFQIRDQFWIPHNKLHRARYLFFNLKTCTFD